MHPEWAAHFRDYHLTGSFLLYDLKNDAFAIFDSTRCAMPFAPASTFKVFNSLVALETGVAPDEHMVLRWDGVKRERPSWNQDQDMATAIKNSTVWYYQEIARRIGRQRMGEWVTREHYGTMDISSDIDQFWLNGTLKISSFEQIDFLRRLHARTLHFSTRSMEIVQRMIILRDTTGYILRGKTGWHTQDGKNLGWFVGYLEQKGNVYFFAITVGAPDPAPPSFARARQEITERILKSLGLL